MPDHEGSWEVGVRQVSAECILYQTLNLVERLDSISPNEHPKAACDIRDAFKKLAEWIKGQLWELVKRGELPYEDEVRVRKLARLVQEIHFRLRFLEVSDPIKTPPVLQHIVDSWKESFIPSEKRVTALVRPQWKYNLEYRLLTQELLGMLIPAELDPDLKLNCEKPDELLRKLLAEESDFFMSILSFASLDTDDTLLISLLAHEFGHLLEQIHVNKEWESNFRHELRWLQHDQLDEALRKIEIKDPEQRAEILQKELNELTEKHKREILADLVATRMMGFGFFVAHAETLKTLARSDLDSVTSAGYPGTKNRLKLVLDELLSQDGLGFEAFLAKAKDKEEKNKQQQSDASHLLDYINSWKRLVNKEDPKGKPRRSGSSREREGSNEDAERNILLTLLEERTKKALPLLIKRARNLVPSDCAAKCDYESFFLRLNALRQEVPPLLDKDTLPGSLAEIISVAWAFQLLTGNSWERDKIDERDRHIIYKRTCRLVLKAIELAGQDFQGIRDKEEGGSCKSFSELYAGLDPAQKDDELKKGGVYDYQTIIKRLDESCPRDLTITLVPAFPGSVQGASVDVHLGNWFKVFRRAGVGSINLEDENERRQLLQLAQKVEYRPLHMPLIMHPGDLVLGCTLEFLALPLDTVATVDGKSQLGRLGLIVATATQIAPGFHGVVVLELVNAGMIPFELRPGMQVAQLVFRGLASPVPEKKKYKKSSYCQIMP